MIGGLCKLYARENRRKIAGKLARACGCALMRENALPLDSDF
jgi:hypothetical protein